MIILKQGAQASQHHGDKQIMPKFSIIIKDDNSIYHSNEELEKKIKDNDYNIEYFTIDDYINKKIDNKKKKQKIQLKE